MHRRERRKCGVGPPRALSAQSAGWPGVVWTVAPGPNILHFEDFIPD